MFLPVANSANLNNTGTSTYNTTAGRASGSVGGQGPNAQPASARLLPSPHGSIMSAANDKFEVMDDNYQPRHSHWKRWAAGVAAVLALIGLAIGLGVGLGLKHDDDDDGDSGTNPTSTPSPCPNCTTTGLPTSGSSDTVSPGPTSDPDVSLYDIDMFLHQNLTVVRELRAQGMDVICYFSAGSYEPWRPDSWKFEDADKGNELDGWPGEHWLDLNSDNVRQIMTARIEIAAQMNCTGVDPDNVDGYDNDNGLDLTEDDSISFVRFLAQEASSRGLMIGLKNAGAIIDDVIDYVQFSVNEQCSQYNECDTYSAFPNASKPVFHIEYPAGEDGTVTKSFDTNKVSKFCNIDGVDSTEQVGFNTVLKNMNLDGFVQYCDEKTYITEGSTGS